jgi:hypothetical protein
MKPDSRAVTKANTHFKQAEAKPKSDYEKAEQSFHENRERLKAERMDREAKQSRESD